MNWMTIISGVIFTLITLAILMIAISGNLDNSGGYTASLPLLMSGKRKKGIEWSFLARMLIFVAALGIVFAFIVFQFFPGVGQQISSIASLFVPGIA